MAKAVKAAAPGAQRHVLKLKVTLRGSKPPIWRRLLIAESESLAALSRAIMIAMEWDGGHLHAFDVAGSQYGDPEMLEGGEEEDRYQLARLIRDGVKKFTYTYDFGDDWEHTIVVEGREPAVEGKRYPVCVAGKRAAPFEDCGGIWGYQDLLEVLATPDHPDREERLEWLGEEIDPEDFDPEEFDLEEINARLAACFPGE